MFHMVFVSHMDTTCETCVLHVICEIWSKPLKSGRLGGSGGPWGACGSMFRHSKACYLMFLSVSECAEHGKHVLNMNSCDTYHMPHVTYHGFAHITCKTHVSYVVSMCDTKTM